MVGWNVTGSKCKCVVLASVLVSVLLIISTVAGCTTVEPSVAGCTRAELDAFLASDLTDEHPWVLNEYMCGHFTETLIANASMAGITMWPTYLYMRGCGMDHIICAVWMDGQLWFVEPQTDMVIAREQLPIVCRGYMVGQTLKHTFYHGSYLCGSPFGLLDEIGMVWG